MLMHRRAWKSTVAPIALVLVLGLGCKKTKQDPFPASGAIAGWQKTGATRVFEAKDLWQYIDGDAEQYIQAGVVSTSTADYKYHGQSRGGRSTCTPWGRPTARARFLRRV